MKALLVRVALAAVAIAFVLAPIAMCCGGCGGSSPPPAVSAQDADDAAREAEQVACVEREPTDACRADRAACAARIDKCRADVRARHAVTP